MLRHRFFAVKPVFNPSFSSILLLFYFSTFLLSFSKQAQAQYRQTIRGQVTERGTGIPIGGATIVLSNDSTTGSMTDANGYYRLTGIAVGRTGIDVSMVGYQTQILPDLLLTTGKELVMNVELTERVDEIKQIVVSAATVTKPINELAAVSARSFSVEEANRMAGNFGDVARQAANYAGVGTGDDINNGIIIRGNSPFGVLWRLEGVDIPNPNHFSFVGTSGGYFTILNNNVTANSDFLTSAFPAEYGNKAGGVFDVHLRNGNNERREWTAQVGLNGLELGAEGPIKRGESSYLVHYRNFNLSLLKQAGVKLNFSGLPNFQDVNFKLNIPTKKMGKFTVFGIGGLSSVALLESEKAATDWTFSDRAEDIRFGSDMGVIGVSNTYFFNPNLVGRAYAALSGSRISLLREWVSSSTPPVTNETLAFNESKASVRYDLTYKLNPKNLFRFGLIYSAINWDYTQKALLAPKYNEYGYPIRLKDEGGLVQLYGQLQHRFTEKATLNIGIHLQDFLYNDSKSVEPRASFQYALAPKHTVSFGYGVHAQMQPLIFYSAIYPRKGRDTTTNRGIDFTRSQHLVLGYDWSVAPKTHVKGEVYYQYISDAPTTKAQGATWFSGINSGSDYNFEVPDSLQNKGTGYNYGVELTLEKFFEKNYYFLTTLSVFDSKYKASDGVWRNTVFNNKFVWNVVGGYEWNLTPNTALSLDTKLTLAGGKPYTPIDLDRSRAVQNEVYDFANSYSQHFPLYYRCDVKASLRLNQKKLNHFIYIGANNVLDSKNPLKQSFNKASQTVVTEYMQGFLPVFGYRIQF